VAPGRPRSARTASEAGSLGLLRRLKSFLVHRAPRAVGQAVVVAAYRLLAAVGIVSMLVSTGCYTYPARTTSEVNPPALVAVDVTDAGRVELSDQMGNEVKRIEGQVVQRSDSALRLMVTEVSFLNGTSNKWQGQEVTIRPLDVKALSQRTYSRQRTLLATLALGGLIAVTVATKGFSNLFSGDPSTDGKGGGPPPDQ
jgi:hypothetical protein